MRKTRDEEQAYSITKIKEDLVKFKIALFIACTGFGKGEILKLISQSIKGSMIIIVPRVNLVRDLAQRTGGSIYCASLGEKNISKITIATKQSLKDLDLSVFSLCCLDEVHGYTEEFLETVTTEYVIGFTATPFRSDGYIYGEKKFWNKPCYEFHAKEAIAAGYLSDYKMIGSGSSFDLSIAKNRKTDYTEKEVSEIVSSGKHENQVKEIVEICDKYKRKKVVLLCANIEHAELLQNEIEKYEDCLIVHSKMKQSHKIIEEYAQDSTRFITSVMMLSEGTDIPIIDCIIFLRPTRSTRLMMQASGRGLRLYTGKDYCLLLDFASVFMNCGTPKNPLIISDDKSESSNETVRTCEECFYIYEEKGACPRCGHEKEPEKRDVEKNLKESIFEESHTVLCEKHHLWKNSRTKNGSPFITVKRHGEFISMFGYQTKQFWAAMKRTGVVEIAIDRGGKYPKVLGIRAWVKNQKN